MEIRPRDLDVNSAKNCPPPPHPHSQFFFVTYSGNPPYGHLDVSHVTATIFWPEHKLNQSFSYLNNPFNTATLLTRPDFRGPLMTRPDNWCSTVFPTHYVNDLSTVSLPRFRSRLAICSFGVNLLKCSLAKMQIVQWAISSMVSFNVRD